MTAPRVQLRKSDTGLTLVDVLVGTAVIVASIAIVVPLTTHAADSARARAAAGDLAGRLRLARVQAIRTGASTALVFDAGTTWSFRLCRDGNGDGVRRVDVNSGDDPCAPPEAVDERFAGVRIGLDPAVPDLDRVTGRDDGVRFGRSAMASCSPAGHAQSG